jgi:outer membrane receptor for ferrienterochelin and colicin
MVQELQFISGAFNAEYGRAMSGIVNIITKSGAKEFSGGITTYGGDFISGNDDIYPNIDDLNPAQIRNIEGNLQGPLYKDKISFFLNARAINFESAIYGKRVFNPQNLAYFDSTDTFQLFRDAEGEGDNKYVSMHGNRKYYLQGKLFYQLSNNVQISLSSILDDVNYREWNSLDNERNYKYNPDGAPKKFRTGLTNLFKIVHTLNQNTFYELGLSYVKKTFEKYVYEDPHDSRYVHPTLTEQLPFSYNTGGTDHRRFKRETETLLAKVDLTNQFSQNHLLKLGLEFNKYNVFFEDIQLRPIEEQTDFNFASDSPYIQTRILDESTIYTSRYDKNPTDFSAYIQDKMEFGELIINAGFRIDYFSPDGVVLNDETDPNIYNPIRPENRYHDTNSNGIQDEGEPNVTHAERASRWYKNATSKLQFSPRFGAAFPITDRGAFHFSYGHFFQLPNFQRLYQNPHFTIGSGTGNQGVIGNADLKPEKTVSGEVGVQQMITDNTSMDITGYFRDVRDLAGTRADEIIIFGGFARYSKIINSDFGFIRGVVLSLNHRFSNSLSSMLDFTYQIAKGSNSDPEQARNALAGGALPEVQLTPLNWDQRYTLNVSLTYDGTPWSGSIIGKYGTGTPYTPRRATDITSLLTNSQSKPHRYNVDLTVSRIFKVSGFGMKGFVRILNLFDTMNQTNVYDDTGKADFTTDEERIRLLGWPEFVNSLEDWYTNPLYYSEPRRVEFGLKVSF